MGVRSLGREDPLQEGMAIHSSILAWGISWPEEPGISKTIHGVTKSRTQRSDFHNTSHILPHKLGYMSFLFFPTSLVMIIHFIKI